MGQYSWRDLVRVPGLLSLIRLPLAAVFPAVADAPRLALAVLGAAALSDVLDGWYARRFGQVTATGAALDPLTDKLFVIVVVVTLAARGLVSPSEVVLVTTREIGELPLVVWLASDRAARRTRALSATANAPGKLATSLQFVSIVLVLIRSPFARDAIVWTALVGAAAAVLYWSRALRESRSGRARE